MQFHSTGTIEYKTEYSATLIWIDTVMEQSSMVMEPTSMVMEQKRLFFDVKVGFRMRTVLCFHYLSSYFTRAVPVHFTQLVVLITKLSLSLRSEHKELFCRSQQNLYTFAAVHKMVFFDPYLLPS